MQGFFIVRPYAKDFTRYSDEEGRNIWSYELDLDEFQKTLIKLHIWELKDVEIEYLFQNYNCATLTLYVLSVANPALRASETLFVSPVDVAKAAASNNMIKHSSVTLAKDWELNLLRQELAPEITDNIEKTIFENDQLILDGVQDTSRALAKDYLSLLISKPNVKKQISEPRLKELEKVSKDIEHVDVRLDLTESKNPIYSPQDSIVGTRFWSLNEETLLDISFLPASHYLYGDNRQYFTESELKMGEVVVRANLNDKRLRLHKLTLYSVNSYVPSSDILPEFSGSFYMGYRQRLNNMLDEKDVVEISGSLGKSYRVHKDVLVYDLFGAGVAGNRSDIFLFAEPKIGAIMNLVGDSKLILEHSASHGQFNENRFRHDTSATYSWYGVKNVTAYFTYASQAVNDLRQNAVSVGFNYHF